MAVASLPRASWAADPARSRGRLHAEEASASRSDFRRDCDRVIHSTAFRRLKHKTQVFVSHEGDHFRTRLTHTLEVAQIARALARSLGLDEDLAEALALAHDLGHPPFGHAGEHALDQCMSDFGGFDHNAQTLRVVTSLEHRYAGFDGLNLTFETLEGIAKHNGPLTDRAGKPIGRYANGLPSALAGYAARHDLLLWSYPSAEAQAAAIADDIAYDAHDLDDALRAGLFAIEDLRALPVAGAILAEVNARYGEIDRPRLVNEITRRLIHAMIEDVVMETGRRVAALGITSVDAVRGASQAVAGFSPAMQEADQAIKGFLTPRMYRSERVLAIMGEAQAVVRDLFARFSTHPEDLPPQWEKALGSDPAARARRIADFIAGMTDNFALEQHARFFDSTPKLR
jgi:dGTPase